MMPDPSPLDELSRTFKEKLWKDQIKSLLDFRSFLRQRRVLIEHPTDEYPADAVAAADWRPPLAFALQATLLVGVVAGVIGKAFEQVVEPRPVTVLEVVAHGSSVEFHPRTVAGGASWDTKRSILEGYRETTSRLLDNVRSGASTDSFPPPVPYSEADNPTLLILDVSVDFHNVSRDHAIALYLAELASLDRQIAVAKLAPRVESAYRILRFVTAGVSLVLAAYAFRLLSRFHAPAGYDVAKSHTQFLYAVPAYLFWPNVVLSALLVAYAMYERYFPPGFDHAVHELDAALRSIDEPRRGWNPMTWSGRDALQVGFVSVSTLLLLWSYCQVRRAARWLSTALRLSPDHQKGFYRGLGKIRKDILVASGLSGGVISIVATLSALAIGVAGLWLSAHRL